MFIRRAEEIDGTKGDVRTASSKTRRFLHREDGMGFTFTDATFEPGMDMVIWYKHHLEACYCLEGEAMVEDLSDGTVYKITLGTLYVLDNHDRHRLRVRTRLRLVCVLNPALVGSERHEADGSFPLL